MGRHREPGNERLGAYVQRRSSGILELRFPIPTDVAPAFAHADGRPRHVLIKSLRTTDVKIANVEADALRTSIRQQIADVRSARVSPRLEDFLRWLYDEEMTGARRSAQAEKDAQTAALFGRVKSPVSDQSKEMAAMNRRWQGDALLSNVAGERMAVAGWAADLYFRKALGREPVDSPEYREVLDKCAATMVDTLIAQHEVAAGRAEPIPTSASLAPPPKQSDDGTTALSERGLQRISSYFEQVYTPFLISSPSMKGARTLSGKQRAVQLFADLIGDKPIYLISQSDMWRFCEEVGLLPDPRSLSGASAKLNARQQLDAMSSGKLQAKQLSPKTVNKHISGIVTLLAHAERRRDISKGCGKNVRAEIDYEEDTGRSFSTDELNRIFKLPLFAGCQGDLVEAGLFKSGPVMIRDDRFWIPLLLLFTGGRSSEIVGLDNDDVLPDHEVPHLLIQVNGLRRLKNKYSRRMVPIHPDLVAMGFLDFARGQIAKGGDQFFPLAVQEYYLEKVTGLRQKKSLSSSSIMRQFNRTFLDHADASESGGSIKCFRNTFEQESLAQISSDEARLRLTGRDPGSTAKIYTKNIPLDQGERTDLLHKLLADITKITYRRVDLEHLKLSPPS